MAGNTSQPSIKRVWGIAKSPELKLTDEELHLLVQAHTGREEWNGRSSDCFIWEHYLMDAISYMLCQREGMSSRASLEAVGAAKVLKLAIRLREFSEEVREKGEHEYKLVDQYNYIKDILDA